MRILIIANPISGSQAAPQVAEQVRQCLARAGRTVELYLTTGKGDAFNRSRLAIQEDWSAVVVCGGDGTLQEAATALEGNPLPLGIIPRGRCNDFAHALGLHRQDPPEKIAEILLRGHVRTVDLGAVGLQRFLTVATLGFDSDASRFVETRKLWIKGTPAYLYAVVRVLLGFRFPFVKLRGDFGELQGRLLLAATANAPTYGGAMRIAPAARLDDGLFHLTVVEAVSRFTVLKMLPKVIKGTHITHPKVRIMTSAWVEIEAPEAPVWVCADGESLTQTPCRFEIRPRALRVIVPGVANPPD